MRILNFRAWDTELNFFCDPLSYYIGLDGSAWFNNCGEGKDNMYDQSSKLIIEQFTGLTDKNGKKIYEGDILEILSANVCKDIMVVKSFMGNMCICHNGDDTGSPIYPVTINMTKGIIGNIHETPELIQSI